MGREHYLGYEEEIREHRFIFNRAFAYIAIILILLGVGLDYGLYPEKQWLFGGARVLASMLIYCVLLILETKWGQDRAEYLAFVWLLLPQIMITWMIAVTEGATSMYSIGLYLAIFGSSIGLPFSLRLNLVLGAATFLFYVVACSYHPESFVLRGAFVVNSLILLFVIVISATSSFFNERARFMLFRLKTALAEKNSQLEETNKSLSEIKGQMLQQEKMAALGTLSAGLLHEVNNPVNYCLMALDVAKEKPAAKNDAGLHECLEDAKQGMTRVQQIVADLKKFAYRPNDGSAENSPFLFDKALDTAIRMVGFETKDIVITRELPADTLVLGDETAVIGVLINLLDNAALAMHTKDYAGAGATPAIQVSAVWEGGRLRITVRDNGPGIAPENLARVFEPFFTTRDIGRGLGLGLSISFGVIERHGGKLVAESELGKWTRMIFDLPGAA